VGNQTLGPLSLDRTQPKISFTGFFIFAYNLQNFKPDAMASRKIQLIRRDEFGLEMTIFQTHIFSTIEGTGGAV
jgi:hypothetical protein